MKRKVISIVLVICIILSFVNITTISASAATNISIGDYIQMGTYYGEPILWRCVDIDQNGPLILSDKIICIKPFDAYGTNANGSHGRGWSNGYKRKQEGSNYWGDSNIRCWLNSNANSGDVVWTCGNPPDDENCRGKCDGYSNEKGFLTNFTSNELEVIKTVRQYTDLDEYDKSGSKYFEDRCFLLSVTQAKKVLTRFGENYYVAKVTQQAYENCEYTFGDMSPNENWTYWLRTPCDYYSQQLYLVRKEGYLTDSCAANSSGIRPAFYLADNANFTYGDGSKGNPYSITNPIGTSYSPYTSIYSPVYSTEQQKILNDLKFDTNNLLKNISYGNHPIKGPSVTLFGNTFHLFEFDGKLNFEHEKIPVSFKVDMGSKSVQVLWGFKRENWEADIGESHNDTTHWSQAYQQVKSLYKGLTGKNVNTTKLWNQFSSLRSQLKDFKSDLLVDATCKVAGYMEISYETGVVKFTEGGIIMEASIGGEFVGKIPNIPPAYVVLGLEASLEGKIYIAYEQYVSINSELNAKIAANVGVGLGSKKAESYFEGGLVGELGAKMLAVSGSFKDYTTDFEPLIVTIKGEIYLKGSFLGFLSAEKTWPIGEPVQLYPKNDISLMSYALLDEDSIDDVIANSTPLSREYLNDVMLMSIDDSDKLYSDKSIYSYNAPVLTTLVDGSMLLLWVDDLGTKNDINKTSLMYSIYDGEVWSKAKELFETGTYNGAPAIFNDGEAAHIIWSKAKTVFADDAGLEDLIVDTELNYTSFANGEFSEPVVLTDNGLFEINYDIIENNGKMAVAWSENNENNPYMTSGTNSLYLREYKDGSWSDKELVSQSDNAIDEIELYYVDDAVNCAYTLVNADNSTNVYNNSDMLSVGGYLNYCNGVLYYLSDSKIMAYETISGTLYETGLDGVNNFSIHEGNAYSLVSKGFACELYESICTNGVFSPWEQVTEFDKYIRDYSVTTDSLGEPVYALNLVDINEGENIYGASELAVCKATDINALEVTAVYYDQSKVSPYCSLPLNIDVTNVGTTDISNLNISITDNNGVVLSSGTVDTEIVCGESATIVYKYTLPSKLELYDITVTVTSGENERNLDNNSITTSVGYADIMMQDVVIEKTENGAVASGTIYNAGYSNATNAILSIYNSSYPDEVLTTIDCADIASGETYEFTYDIPEKYLTLDDKMTMYGLSFKASSDSEELNYANNTEKVVFGELTDYTVAFVDGSQLLDIVSVDEFENYSVDKEGYTLEGWYASSTLEADSKITTMPSDISENLIVFANWIPISIDRAEYTNTSISVNATVSEELLSKSGIVILAIYQNERLVSGYSTDISSSIEHTFNNINEADNYTIKMFVLNGFSDLKPICDTVCANVK